MIGSVCLCTCPLGSQRAEKLNEKEPTKPALKTFSFEEILSLMEQGVIGGSSYFVERQTGKFFTDHYHKTSQRLSAKPTSGDLYYDIKITDLKTKKTITIYATDIDADGTIDNASIAQSAEGQNREIELGEYDAVINFFNFREGTVESANSQIKFSDKEVSFEQAMRFRELVLKIINTNESFRKLQR